MRSYRNAPRGRDPDAGTTPGCLGSRLQNLRHLRGTRQLSLAEALHIGQPALSHLERRDDILVSSLAAYIEALGGTLQIAAIFPNADPVKLLGGADWMLAPDVPEPASRNQLSLPTIPEPKQRIPSRDIVLSIRPTHALKILTGTKTVELRRRFTTGVRPGTLALIYATRPTSALTGVAEIQDVQRLTLHNLWRRHSAAACLEKADFESYFSGLRRGYAIVLHSAKPLTQPVALAELRERFGFEPPQSYQYASLHMRGLVEHERSQTPH